MGPSTQSVSKACNLLPRGTTPGLGLLNVDTVMVPEKRLALATGTHLPTGTEVRGYEIHIGRTEGPDCARSVLSLDGRAEGARSPDGRVQGLYLHGMFTEDAFRSAWLAALGGSDIAFAYGAGVEKTLDDLADHLERHADLDALLGIAKRRQ